ncbi:MAG TPA: DUF2470 domain-containing protein [Alphaproteobacteria bacterium]|nr:DUF2470 domain-containing protein [Alphaproteobacteria bacterium]
MSGEPKQAENRDGEGSRIRLARRLLRGLGRAALATAMADGGWPYASLVMVAADYDGSPLLLLSDLAEHSRNIARDPRVSLLFDGTAGLAEPLTGPRLSVLGEARPDDTPRRQARYLARHPDAEGYAGFGDFRLYRVAVTRAHLVAGFGRIDWIGASELLLPEPQALAAADWEAAVVAHMNADHADAVDLCARALLGGEGSGWRLTGCDVEGCDLRRGGAVLRLDFPAPAPDAAAVRTALVQLVRDARARHPK